MSHCEILALFGLKFGPDLGKLPCLPHVQDGKSCGGRWPPDKQNLELPTHSTTGEKSKKVPFPFWPHTREEQTWDFRGLQHRNFLDICSPQRRQKTCFDIPVMNTLIWTSFEGKRKHIYGGPQAPEAVGIRGSGAVANRGGLIAKITPHIVQEVCRLHQSRPLWKVGTVCNDVIGMEQHCL